MSKINVVAIIPARGGSKRIPGKNYKMFNDKPIIKSTIEKLKKSKIFNRIIVSTDSKKIASISKKSGAEVPFIRPKFLSGDNVFENEVVCHSINYLIKQNYKFDYVCCVYAPNPFLEIIDLKKGLKKARLKKFDYVFSATSYRFPYFRSFTIANGGKIKMLFNKYKYVRSQDLKKIMCDTGQFYWGHKKTWFKKKFPSSNSGVVEIPKWRYHDIDTFDDWKRAEIYKKYIK